MTFCKANERQKCVEYLMENDRNIDENVCVKPNEKSYEYALSKLLKQVETFKKGINRPSTKAQYDSYLGSFFRLPKGTVEKHIPHTTTNEKLNLKEALRGENLKNETVLKISVNTRS